MSSPSETAILLSRARELEGAGRPGEALSHVRRGLDLAPDDSGAKRLAAALLREQPGAVSPDWRAHIERLLVDPDIAPEDVAAAGWTLLLGSDAFGPNVLPGVMAQVIEADIMALRLMEQACVSVLEAELAMSGLRRWLLLSGREADYPRLTSALIAQATHNGGAWPFNDDEREALGRPSALAAAYQPPAPTPVAAAHFDNAVTQAVADQYFRWPYPDWSRITVPEASTIPAAVEKLDSGRPSGLPVRAEILVAGCGTGREAALLARRYPDSRVTAIDVSERSLAYAAERCGGMGIEFRCIDLHEVEQLGRQFHFIACSGVLHHLPDPEAGWARLKAALAPRGVMKVMLYSRFARLRIEAAKLRIVDFRTEEVTDDQIRAVRCRLIETSPQFVADFSDFYSMAGAHDLLLNRQEDPFDVSRIERCLTQLDLELLAFRLPSKSAEAAYRSDHPHDPDFRDFRAWASLERANPLLFSGMYEFWCRESFG